MVAQPSTANDPPKATDRKYAPDSFADRLWDFLGEDHTEVHLGAFLAPHDGEWIRIGGYLTDTMSGQAIKICLRSNPKGTGGHIWIEMVDGSTAHVAQIKRYAHVRVECQIVADDRGRYDFQCGQLL